MVNQSLVSMRGELPTDREKTWFWAYVGVSRPARASERTRSASGKTNGRLLPRIRGEALGFLEAEGGGVDAIAHPGGVGAVVE